MQKVHFISGLPRSGSTLLSALLSQNPRFSADISSPALPLWGAIIPQMNGNSELRSFFDDELRSLTIKSIFSAYYTSKQSADVIFDTHRGWTNYLSLLNICYPYCRIICCIRDLPAIIGSFERALIKNPLRTSAVFRFRNGSSIYWRVKTLMNPDTGVIGRAYDALRGAWYGEKSHMLIAVDYDVLVREPQAVLDRLYAALDEPRFEHDFNNIKFDRPRYDEDLGMPGLHKVRERIEILDEEPALPPDIVEQYKNFSFWREESQGLSKVLRLF